MLTLEIDGWKLGLTFSAAHFLADHTKCERLHGHTYAVHLKVEGEPGPTGMVVDFVALKRVLREIVAPLDHGIMIPQNGALNIAENEDSIDIEVGGKRYLFPREEVKLLPTVTTTVEDISGMLLDRLMDGFDFPDNVGSVSLGVDEGPGQGSWRTVDLSG